jgi:hypothetical protein
MKAPVIIIGRKENGCGSLMKTAFIRAARRRGDGWPVRRSRGHAGQPCSRPVEPEAHGELVCCVEEK